MLDGILAALSPMALLVTLGGVVLGIIFGAIPGLTATFAIAILIPVTFLMEPVHGMIMLAGIYAGSIYGGSVSAILLNIPGTPASIVTAWEGNAMARRGQAPLALGLSAVSSGLGGLFSGVVLMFLTPVLSVLALRFGGPENVALVLFSFAIVVLLLDTPVLANITGLFLGLILAVVGTDPLTASPRFIFGQFELFGGFSIVAVLVGFFCLPQALILAAQAIVGDRTDSVGRVGASKAAELLRTLRRNRWNLLRSSAIGTGLGILPAVGPESTPLVAHTVERRMSREPEAFGKGSEDGLVAAEASVSANVGGSLIPLLSLGIPGSGAAAVFVGALTLHGLQPGPLLFRNRPDIVFTFFAGFIIVNLIMTVVGLYGARYLAACLRLSKALIATFVAFFSIFGAYAVSASLFDVWVMFGAAALAILVTSVGIPILPVVLAFILGGVLESNLAITIARADGLGYFLGRPITLVLGALTLAIIGFALWRGMRRRPDRQSGTPDGTRADAAGQPDRPAARHSV